MATTSEVKAGLDDIANLIRKSRQRFNNSKDIIQTAYNDLNNIPTIYSDVINTIDAYAGVDDFESLCQAEKAKLTTEFIALRDEINTLIASF